MVETIEELEQYRLKVVAELERRVLRVQELDNQIENARVALDIACRARTALSANTARNQIEAAHRSQLRNALRDLEVDRAQAQGDLAHAEERLREVDNRIASARGEGN